MKKQVLLISVVLFGYLASAYSWGGLGHNVIAAVADKNLNPVAKERIEKYLGNKTMMYYASWMDRNRKNPDFDLSFYGHTVPVNDNLYYTDDLFVAPGNAAVAIETAIERLKNYQNLPEKEVAYNLYCIIHLVGDMHCPGHIKYPGMKKFSVLDKDKKVGYHKVWDSWVVDKSHPWSYSEWAENLNRLPKSEISTICAGSIRDWVHQTAVDCQVIYKMAEKDTQIGSKADRSFINEGQLIVERQMQRAGYRLAKVLNELFS